MILLEVFKIMQIAVVVIMWIYVVFAFIVTRQVNLMNKSFNTSVAGFFVLIARIHFFVSLGVALLGTMYVF